MSARGLKRRRETEAYRLHEIAAYVENLCVLCLCASLDRKQHRLWPGQCPNVGYSTCIECLHSPSGDGSLSHLSRQCPQRFKTNESNLCYTCLFPSEMDGKVFHDGGWSPCSESKRIDKVKPVCWFVFRHKHALLQQTFGLEHVSSQEKYSQWLGQRHVTFGCNGLFVFYWYMDRYVSLFLLGSSGNFY
jgi:hypothetical protein